MWWGAALMAAMAWVAMGPPSQAGWFDGGDPKVGKPAPGFTAVMPDGRKLTLDDYRGQVPVINFWATWCGPCKRELPLLDTFYKVNKDRGLRVIAVTTEGSLPMYKLAPLQKVLTVPLMGYLRGPYTMIDGAVPTNYVIDRAGVVRYAKAEAFDLDTLNSVIRPLLSEPAPAPTPGVAIAASPGRSSPGPSSLVKP